MSGSMFKIKLVGVDFGGTDHRPVPPSQEYQRLSLPNTLRTSGFQPSDSNSMDFTD